MQAQILFSCFVFTFSLSIAFQNIPSYLDEFTKSTKLWAVLVAGSSSWGNYRHQADVCHAYQVLHNHGIPDERIIIMMYDDIANNTENPTPGVIINHVNGKDVYKGVPHDYIGEAVTPENFMAVLKGDKKTLVNQGSGKVLESGPNDHVFIYFSDHGAPGLIAFPETELTATDLNKTVEFMFEKKMYSKMVIYIEACESGSMFQNILPNNKNVYATTAANAEESSYACYWDDKRETFLGDLYSVNWLEDSDRETLTKETLSQQFKVVKKETNDSHVQEYGDMRIAKLHVSEFQGKKPAAPIVYSRPENMNIVRSRDVPLEIIKRKYGKSNSLAERTKYIKKLDKVLKNRSFLVKKVEAIVSAIFNDVKVVQDTMQKHYKLTDFACYDNIRQFFNAECFQLSKNPFALDYLYVLVNLCEMNVFPSRSKIAMEEVCDHPPIHNIV